MPDWLPQNLAEVLVFTPLRIVVLVVLALVARFLVHRLIDRSVRRAIAKQPQSRFRAARAFIEATSPPVARRQQRISSLGSLGKSVATVMIFTFAILMILTEMEFNITAILAGTSVVGVAVAFGTQNIVKDLISGVFMLVEDQLGVGDFVDMEKASGTVEEIGLRVTHLRDDDGVVWYVRNGEVLAVGNYSQGGPGRPPPEPEITPPE